MSTQRQHSNARLRPVAAARPRCRAAALRRPRRLYRGAAAHRRRRAPETSDVMPMPFRRATSTPAPTSSPPSRVPFEITVPDGWGIEDDLVLDKDVDDAEEVFVLFSNPTHVPTDACAVVRHAHRGRSLGRRDSPMRSRRRHRRRRPLPSRSRSATISGVEFDLAVESDVDIDDCAQSQDVHPLESRGCCTLVLLGRGPDARPTACSIWTAIVPSCPSASTTTGVDAALARRGARRLRLDRVRPGRVKPVSIRMPRPCAQRGPRHPLAAVASAEDDQQQAAEHGERRHRERHVGADERDLLLARRSAGSCGPPSPRPCRRARGPSR